MERHNEIETRHLACNRRSIRLCGWQNDLWYFQCILLWGVIFFKCILLSLQWFTWIICLLLAVTGVTPRSGWAVDPFGHSATMPYLLKKSNLTSMLIQRIHYSIKKHFSSTRNLEFMWRQAWGEWTRASNAIYSVLSTRLLLVDLLLRHLKLNFSSKLAI